MSRAAALALGAAALGFALGFLWGARTREELPGATDYSFRDGVLTLTVNAAQALRQGLRGLLG